MTEHLKQSISALLDEEATEIEVHRLLREFDAADGEKSAELKASWVRYQQIRAVSQGHHRLSETQHLSLHASISEAIAAEDEHDLIAETRPAWQKQTAGLAVAASLVMAVFVGVNLQQQNDSLEAPGLAVAPAETATTSAIGAQPVANEEVEATELVAFNEDELELRELDAEKQQRLREYLMRHDRSSQMNNQTQTVLFPARAPAPNNSTRNGNN